MEDGIGWKGGMAMKEVTKTILCVVLAGCMASGVRANESEDNTISGSLYISARYLNGQVNDSDATLHEPGVFEGKTNVEFDGGSGLGIAGGVLAEEDDYFVRLELEWLMHSCDLANTLPSTYFESANSYEQLCFNLNVITGLKVQDRLRAYVFGGIGYTEVTLPGRYGSVIVSRGDESWDSTFGYHAGAGVCVQLYDRLYLDLGGRYYGTTDPRFGNSETWIEIPNSGYILHFGLAYHFAYEMDPNQSWSNAWRNP